MKSLALTESATYDSEETNLRSWVGKIKSYPKETIAYVGLGTLSEMKPFQYGLSNSTPSFSLASYEPFYVEKLIYPSTFVLEKIERFPAAAPDTTKVERFAAAKPSTTKFERFQAVPVMAKVEKFAAVVPEVQTAIDAVIERVSDEIIDLSCHFSGNRKTIRIPRTLIPAELLEVGTAVKITVDPDSEYRRLKVERRELPDQPLSRKSRELREWATRLE